MLPRTPDDHGCADPLAALEILLGELHREVEEARRSVGKAAVIGDYAHASAIIERAEKLEALQSQFDALGASLRQTLGGVEPVAPPAIKETPDSGRRHRRHSRGKGTPLPAYRAPILRTLVRMGGTGRAADVLASVFVAMRADLMPTDYELLADGRTQRWHKTAEWCRFTMRTEGLLHDDSPRGVWEISGAGRAWLTVRAGE